MISFLTISEAEASLGRNLTYAETLWFKYSSNQSDYLLYCHNSIIFFVFYTLLPLPYIMAELFLSSKSINKFKVQSKIKKSFSNMFKCYKDVMCTYMFYLFPFQLLSFPFIQWIGIRTSLPLPSASEMALQILVYFLVEDYTNYWLHRLLHTKWGYDHIHRVHHEYKAPIGFAAPYAHWAELIILGSAILLGPIIVPGHMVTFWLWMILRQMEAIETHSGFEFPWSPSKYVPFYGGSEYHDYHHYVGGQSQNNFASVFTYCDYIYGTDKGYRYYKGGLRKFEFPWSPSKYVPFYGGSEYHDYHHYVGGQSQNNFASVFTYCDYIYGTDKGYRYYKGGLRKEQATEYT